MTETSHLGLPLLAPAQAQKHVTVNEALTRLDAMVQLRLISTSLATPPSSAVEGDCYGVPMGAVNDWAGREGQLACFTNNGWDFVAPKRGWRAMVLDQGHMALFDGTAWRGGGLSLTPGGAGMAFKSVELVVPITAGPTVTTSPVIPEKSIVFGVTGIVTSAITGTLGSWSLGVAGDPQLYGNGIGLGVNAAINGPGTPSVYWADTSLELTADAGDFAGGAVLLALHYAQLSLPDWL